MDRDTPALICHHVRDGAAILYVCRDSDGDWQFLCGADHSDDEQPVPVSRQQTIATDPRLQELDTLAPDHRAERTDLTAPWQIQDESTAFIDQCIAEHGWAVEMIEAGDTAEQPEFAYTVGLHRSFGHPELILVGLPGAQAHAILNLCGDRVRDGESLAGRERVGEILEDMDVGFRQVQEHKSFDDYVGQALEYYDAEEFQLLQLLWPDEQGRLPGEAGTSEAFKVQQPELL